MLRRSFLKLTAAILLHPALNWQHIPFEQAVEENFYKMMMYVFADRAVFYNDKPVPWIVSPRFKDTHDRLNGPGLLFGREMVVSERIDDV